MTALTLPDATAWTCAECSAPQVSLRGAVEPGTICAGCAREASPPPAESDPLEAAEIPARYRRGWDLDRWCASFSREVPEGLEEWRGTPSPVVLWGPTGTGKTGLACLLLAGQVTAGRSGLWIRAQDLLRTLKGSIGLGKGEEAVQAELAQRRLLARAKAVDVLVVDDLFAGHLRTRGADVSASPWVLDNVLEILAHRYDHLAATVVTTMLNPARILDLEPSLYSRLTGRGSLAVKLAGDDRRQA